jgi:anti-anti-sigma factor
VRIGPYRLRLADEGVNDEAASTNNPSPNPLEEPVRPGLFPHYCLELFDDSVADPIRPLDRRITLIGRDENCAVRLDDPSVSRVHCALVLGQNGLWVVDLVGKGGIYLDGSRVRIQEAQTGSELVVGKHTMAFWRRDSDSLGSGNENLDEGDSKAGVGPPEELGSAGDWLGSLFEVEHQTGTLIVRPTIQSGMFRYAKLQLELNALRFKLLRNEIANLVLDLSALHYSGSEVICAVVALARQTEARGGRIALCSPTREAKTAFEHMGLLRIWKLYPTREAALAAMAVH